MLACAALITTSCTNDDITITNPLNVSVSLNGLYSSYSYNDTRHDIKISNLYRVFNSEEGKYIQQRTYFYNSNGVLVDSLVSLHTNTNTYSGVVMLEAGTYTVVSILCFANEAKQPYWLLSNRNNLEAASVDIAYLDEFYQWYLMSFDSKQIEVKGGQTTNISLAPSPIGSLAYIFCQDFQYMDETSYGTIADNGVRSICVYAKKKAYGYKLSPNIATSDRYIYYDEAENDKWYYLSDYLTPDIFGYNTYFQGNIYDFFYILTPSTDVCFGYKNEGDSGFTEKGTQYDKTFQNGQMYLAYWDWFAVGNPYFDIADNNHWNTYSSTSAKAAATAKAARGRLFEE